MEKFAVSLIALVVITVSGCASYGSVTSANDTPGTKSTSDGWPSQVVGP